MGFFDKAKRLFGLGEDAEGPDEAREAVTPRPRGTERKGRGSGRERPPLADPPPSEAHTLDEALSAREAGDAKRARAILQEIDRGAGLRVVLRAAAALEAGDEGEVSTLSSALAPELQSWKLVLELASALGDPAAAHPYVELARADGAPAWAIAWTQASSSDETARRTGLVDLLFADAALARTVAARDLAMPFVETDAQAVQRYAAFAHGRDSIRRFGPKSVAELVRRVRKVAP